MSRSRKAAQFDADRCRKRARLAAVRDGVDASPIGFLSWNPFPDEALTRLQSTLAALETPLTPEDVYVHFVEAANSRFIGDRFMFLDASTLKNIATAANGAGIAFMNSHRTGGLSAPSELPFGRTFAGRYEEFADDGGMFGRTVLGLYMLKGVKPNGDAGPSTDDLHRSIEAGTLSDVSIGLAGGTRLCDVCGEELGAKTPEGKFACPHAPGTHKAMEAEHQESQLARGVKAGKASYTLVDAMPQEVSAVYKGAVPGAGFRKALALSKSGGMSLVELSEARTSYAGLLERDDRTFRPARATFLGATTNMDILKAFKFWQAAGEPEEINFESLATSADIRKVEHIPTPFPVEDAEKLALRAKVAELEELARGSIAKGIRREAEQFADAEIAAKRLLPAEREAFVGTYVDVALMDVERPVKLSTGAESPRLDLIREMQSARMPHDLTTEKVGTESVIPKGAHVLSNGVEPPDEAAAKAARLANLMAQTPLGRSAIASN
jgi:hypothetical protein